MNGNCNYSRIDHLVECLNYFTDRLIIDETLAESWINGQYEYEPKTMVTSIEKYNINTMVDKIMSSNINLDEVQKIIDDRIKILLNSQDITGTLSDGLKELDRLRRISVNDSETVSIFINSVNSITNLLNMKSLLMNYDGVNYKTYLYDSKNIRAVKIVSIIYKLILNSKKGDEMLSFLENGINSILYKFKDFDNDTSHIIHSRDMLKDMNIDDVTIYTIEDVRKLFAELICILDTESDYILDFIIEELTSYSDLIYRINHTNNESLNESTDFNIDEKLTYLQERFDHMAVDLFGEYSNDELNVEEFIEFYNVAREISEIEILNEASSRIITKGTDKVTRSISRTSAKSRGMTKSDSKIDQVKRGARIVDDRASDAINRKIDQVINITKDAKREKLITGKNTVKLGKAIKTVVGIIVASGAAKIALGPVVGAGVSAITALGAYALSKRTEEREKKRILLDMETELKIVKEKIEDAKGDNAREQKYQLMRIQASLEKEIARIRHGLRYY